jgi:predicted nucleic acid-binding protein
MIGPVFVDTNVFVYLHDDSEPEKKLRADDWIAFLVGHRSGRLSFQVLQEFYTILTRKLKLGFEEDQYEIAMERFLARARKSRKLEWVDGRRPTRDELHDRTGLR